MVYNTVEGVAPSTFCYGENAGLVFGELKKHIRAGQLLPAYLVTGEDAFLLSSALKQFRALAEPMPDFNLSEIVSPPSAQTVIEACESLPLGADRRVVVVTQCGKTDMSALGAYLDNPCPSTVLVFAAEKPESGLSKIVNRFTIVDCSKLDTRTVLSWIAVKTRECQSGITESAAKLLIEYCANDMSRVSAELTKLCAYRYGGVISDDDVIELTSPTLDFKIFALSEAVANKQPQKAAVILRNLSESGASPVLLLGMLYAHFRRLLYVAVTPSYDRMAADLGVKEYAVKKAKEQSARFTPMKLKRICDNLRRADFDVKSGRMTDKVALELSIFDTLCG